MALKKTTNSLSHSAMPSTFRTLIKNRINKETIKDVVHLSAALQQNLDLDDKRSIKSSVSIHKKSDFLNGTDKIKNFVRNMKTSNLVNDQPAAVKIFKTIDNTDLTNSRTSLYSVRSSKSKASNFNSYHMDKDIADNRSVISTKSLAQSQIMSKSKILFSKHNEDSSKERLIDKLSKMQERIDYLNRNKLKNLMLRARSTNRFNSKPFIGSGSYVNETVEEDHLLERQFENIIAAIQNLKQKDYEEKVTLSELEENISDLDKKIELLEKILASNFTEAEILRKYYFAQKSQKCPHLSRKEKIIHEISKRKEMLKTNSSMIEMRDLRKKQPVIRYESTSKYCYTRPAQAAYLTPKDRMKPIAPNRQPLPRSSYGREFLNYGTLPVFNYKPHDSKQSTSKLHTITSNYQQTFKEKHIELKQINYKQLDCFKDKFKPGSISFSEMYRNKGPVKNISKDKDPLRKQKQNKNSIQKAMDTLNSLQSLTRFDSKSKFMGSSEMKTEYLWHSTEKGQLNEPVNETKGHVISSVIKNGKLNDLKASYRMEFIR